MRTPSSCAFSTTSSTSTSPLDVWCEPHGGAHYGTLAEWWRRTHGVAFLPPECLPPCTILAGRPDRPAAAIALYFMDALIAQVCFAVVDPDASTRATVPALDAAIAEASRIARARLGSRGFLACVTHDPTLHRLVQRHHGFTASSQPHAAHLMFDRSIDPGNISE